MLSSVIARGQEEFIEPPSRFLTRIPFEQLTGGIILLKARLDGFADTLNFILDSGSSGISLDSTIAEGMNLTPVPSNRTVRGIAGIKNVEFLYNHTLHFDGLAVDRLDFHVNDYEILNQVYGVTIGGIIGYSVLSRYIVHINYDSSKIDFYTPGTFRYQKGGYLFRPTLNTLPVTNIRVRDEKTSYSRFLFDIGAGLCMMLSEDFVNDSSLLSKRVKFSRNKPKDWAENWTWI